MPTIGIGVLQRPDRRTLAKPGLPQAANTIRPSPDTNQMSRRRKMSSAPAHARSLDQTTTGHHADTGRHLTRPSGWNRSKVAGRDLQVISQVA
nr:hypothetical protein GCM10017745_48140 [Saccharothrix mutabilis subsp. capreolus]